MQIKIFGKNLFEFKKKGDQLWAYAVNEVKESKYLPDFYNDTGENTLTDYVLVPSSSNGGMVAVPKGKKKSKVPPKEEKKLSPKNVYDLKMLNDPSFKLNADPKYVDEQIASFKEKLTLIKSEEYDMRRGTVEISSMVIRMENRLRYGGFRSFFDQYPYTTTTKIREVTKNHDNLQLGQVAQFVADMPKEAIYVMKEYEKQTDTLCAKKPVFYIIADKKDFKKANTRRDPILLVQSPFGHFWQILGAWDKEMMFLEEL